MNDIYYYFYDLIKKYLKIISSTYLKNKKSCYNNFFFANKKIYDTYYAINKQIKQFLLLKKLANATLFYKKCKKK